MLLYQKPLTFRQFPEKGPWKSNIFVPVCLPSSLGTIKNVQNNEPIRYKMKQEWCNLKAEIENGFGSRICSVFSNDEGWTRGHSFYLCKIYVLCMCMQWMHVWICVYHSLQGETGRQLIGVSVSSRYTQLIRLGRKYLWQLSRLADPEEIL